jgi:hypothetical protein
LAGLSEIMSCPFVADMAVSRTSWGVRYSIPIAGVDQRAPAKSPKFGFASASWPALALTLRFGPGLALPVPGIASTMKTWRAREPGNFATPSFTNKLQRGATWPWCRPCLVATRRVRLWKKLSATSRRLLRCIWRAWQLTGNRSPRRGTRFKEGSPFPLPSPLDSWPSFHL